MKFKEMNMEDIKYHSITYGPQDKEGMFKIIKERIESSPRDFTIYVGTDSQSHGATKVVSVIAILEHGKGGFWFHTIDWTTRFSKEQIRIKIYNETYRSIEMAKEVLTFLYENELDVNLMIHADLGRGKYSKTEDMISNVIGWIEGEGFKAEVKPFSWAASSIADRISK